LNFDIDGFTLAGLIAALRRSFCTDCTDLNQASIAVPHLCMLSYFSLEYVPASIDNDMKNSSGLQFAYGYAASDPVGTKKNASSGAINGYRGGHL
jgi:hypothetical protein